MVAHCIPKLLLNDQLATLPMFSQLRSESIMLTWGFIGSVGLTTLFPQAAIGGVWITELEGFFTPHPVAVCSTGNAAVVEASSVCCYRRFLLQVHIKKEACPAYPASPNVKCIQTLKVKTFPSGAGSTLHGVKVHSSTNGYKNISGGPAQFQTI